MEIEIEGPGTFAIDVVGVSQYQDVLEAAAAEGANMRATLVLEDSNPYDDQAVAVHIDGRRAGYLSRANARLYAPILPPLATRASPCAAKLTSSVVSKPRAVSARISG